MDFFYSFSGIFKGREWQPSSSFSEFSQLPADRVTNFVGTARDTTFTEGLNGTDSLNTPGFSGSGEATASIVTRNAKLSRLRSQVRIPALPWILEPAEQKTD